MKRNPEHRPCKEPAQEVRFEREMPQEGAVSVSRVVGAILVRFHPVGEVKDTLVNRSVHV